MTQFSDEAIGGYLETLINRSGQLTLEELKDNLRIPLNFATYYRRAYLLREKLGLSGEVSEAEVCQRFHDIVAKDYLRALETYLQAFFKTYRQGTPQPYVEPLNEIEYMDRYLNQILDRSPSPELFSPEIIAMLRRCSGFKGSDDAVVRQFEDAVEGNRIRVAQQLYTEMLSGPFPWPKGQPIDYKILKLVDGKLERLGFGEGLSGYPDFQKVVRQSRLRSAINGFNMFAAGTNPFHPEERGALTTAGRRDERDSLEPHIDSVWNTLMEDIFINLAAAGDEAPKGINHFNIVMLGPENSPKRKKFLEMAKEKGFSTEIDETAYDSRAMRLFIVLQLGESPDPEGLEREIKAGLHGSTLRFPSERELNDALAQAVRACHLHWIHFHLEALREGFSDDTNLHISEIEKRLRQIGGTDFGLRHDLDEHRTNRQVIDETVRMVNARRDSMRLGRSGGAERTSGR